MDGIWVKRCPQCGNYIKKTDPLEAGVCRTCGWKEKQAAFSADCPDASC